MSEKWGESTEEMFKRITRWIDHVREYPGFADFQRERFRKILLSDIGPYEPGEDFRFDSNTDKKQDFCLSYLQLLRASMAIKSVEYYFRRYPFHSLPVSHDEHLSNICELFFSRIYQYREKMKNTLNHANKVQKGAISVGPAVRAFDRIFDRELRERHQVHHRVRYEDIDIERLGLLDTLSITEKRAELKEEIGFQYRKVCRVRVKRVRSRSRVIDEITNQISAHFNANLAFLPGGTAI